MRKRALTALTALLIFTAAALGLAGALATFVRWQNCYGPPFSLSIEPIAPLPPHPEVEWLYPRWTRDGDSVMFGVTVTAYEDILSAEEVVVSRTTRAYIASADGSRLSPLDSPNRIYANISPNGSRIAYPDGGAVGVSALDGSDRRRLADDKGWAGAIKWSPDGERIAFERSGADECAFLFFTDTPPRGLYAMKADGSEIHRIRRPNTAPDGKSVEYGAGWSWSPDSQNIGFSGVETGESGKTSSLYTVKPDGSGLAKLFTVPSEGEDGGIRSSPAWSPGGERAAFLMENGGGVNLYTITQDERDLSEVAEISAGGRGVLSWNPVDDSLILASIGSHSYIINIAESSVLIISRARGAAWSPDGARVAMILEDGGWARFAGSLSALELPPISSDGGAGVFAMSPDGSDARLLAVLGDDGAVKANGG